MQGGGPNMFLNMIIRPPQNKYPSDQAEDGKQLNFKGKAVTKKVFGIKNAKGENLQCSYFDVGSTKAVVYMHGNASNKMEGSAYAEMVCSEGFNLLAFDFSGCGNSEGEWVTLGWKEKHDL
jgi:hypothetical protein